MLVMKMMFLVISLNEVRSLVGGFEGRIEVGGWRKIKMYVSF